MPRTRTLRPMTAQNELHWNGWPAGARRRYGWWNARGRFWPVYSGQAIQSAAEEVRRHASTVSQWLTRFEEQGLAGLQDAPKSGRPPTYSEEERGRLMALCAHSVIAIARTHPQALELPFGHWTLDRLVVYAHEQLQLGISRAQLARVLKAEGLRWYHEQVYFSERPDPQFAEKKGPSSHSTQSPRPTPM